MSLVRTILFSFLWLSPLASNTWAASGFDFPSDFTQSEFEDLSRQVGIATSYNPLSPAEPLGILGFDVGIEVTAIDIEEEKDFWKDAVDDDDIPSYVVLPKVHLQKGLPLGIDIGATYSKAPGFDLAVIGGELKWAFLKGGISLPAVAIRGTYTQLLGVDELDLSTYGIDLSISKGFPFVTPYAGIGQLWIMSEEHSGLVDLDDETSTATKGYIGVKVSLFLFNFVAEAAFSEIPLYSLRANVGF